MIKQKKRIKIPYITLIITAVIILLSLMPSGNIPKTGWFIFPGVDKVIHFIMYLTLTFSLSAESGYRKILPHFTLFLIIPLVFVFSAMLELAQLLFTSSRTGDWFDLLANTGGILFAAVLSSFLRRFRSGPFRGFRETHPPDQQLSE